MKKFMLAWLLLSNCLLIFAQKQPAFDTSSSVWFEMKEFGEPPHHFFEKYFIDGDTLLFGKKFHNVYLTSGSTNKYIGSYREENASVYYFGYDYFWFKTDSVVLLYDFECKVNATILTGNWHTNIVVSADSVYAGNRYRKRINLLSGEQWIEGIGSTWGFLYPMTNIPTMYWNSVLSCFKIHDTLIYLNSGFNDCTTKNGSAIEPSQDNYNISVFPNPVLSKAEDILIETEHSLIKTLIIYNLNGRVIYSRKENKTTCIKIPAHHLTPGVYFLQVTNNNNETVTKKLIIN